MHEKNSVIFRGNLFWRSCDGFIDNLKTAYQLAEYLAGSQFVSDTYPKPHDRPNSCIHESQLA